MVTLFLGGDGEDRTLDLMNAIHALSQVVWLRTSIDDVRFGARYKISGIFYKGKHILVWFIIILGKIFWGTSPQSS